MAVVPTDILLSEILPKLHLRTLLQFKSFNKSLYNHISSKEFTDLHLKHTVSSNTYRLLMVFTAVRNDRKKYLYLVNADSPDSPAWYLPLPPPFCDVDEKWYAMTVVGSCNGLLCLKSSIMADSKCCWIILNPCTGKVSINISMSMSKSDPITEKGWSGFGYDALSDDYKLVVVEHFRRMYRTSCRSVKVYSMKANSWKTIGTAFVSTSVSQLCLLPWRANCVLIKNNLMHWRLVRGPKRNVVCFNLETEQWGADVALPKFDHYDCRSVNHLDFGVLRGCLCFCSKNLHDMFVGWIMKEYGVKESWTKFSIDVPAHKLCHSIFANWNGATQEILLVGRYRKCYQWYNIRDKTVKKLELRGAPKHLRVESLCVASLISDFGDHRTKAISKATEEELMKVDKKFKILKVNLEQ